MTEELLEKARAAKSPEELLKLAQESGVTDFTEEQAKRYFERLKGSGELSDEELDASAGGCFDSSIPGAKKVSKSDRCRHGWKCKQCFRDMENCGCFTDSLGNTPMSIATKAWFVCYNCAFATYKNNQWYCTNQNTSK